MKARVFQTLFVASLWSLSDTAITDHSDHHAPPVLSNSSHEIQALLDYESGLIFYKDYTIPACLVENLLMPHEGLQLLKIPISSNESFIEIEPSWKHGFAGSSVGSQFCAGLTMRDIREFMHPENALVLPIHTRKRRQTNGYYGNVPIGEARAQSNWNPPGQASQAQVQGQVFGSGFFSGQAQTQNGGVSQSQVQLAGVGIRGQIASSSGNAQAQLALGNGAGSGQAAGLGQGPSSSQVQVTLGQQGEETMASASATSGGATAGIGGGGLAGTSTPGGGASHFGQPQHGGYGGAGGREGFYPGTRVFGEPGSGASRVPLNGGGSGGHVPYQPNVGSLNSGSFGHHRGVSGGGSLYPGQREGFSSGGNGFGRGAGFGSPGLGTTSGGVGAYPAAGQGSGVRPNGYDGGIGGLSSNGHGNWPGGTPISGLGAARLPGGIPGGNGGITGGRGVGHSSTGGFPGSGISPIGTGETQGTGFNQIGTGGLPGSGINSGRIAGEPIHGTGANQIGTGGLPGSGDTNIGTGGLLGTQTHHHDGSRTHYSGIGSGGSRGLHGASPDSGIYSGSNGVIAGYPSGHSTRTVQPSNGYRAGAGISPYAHSGTPGAYASTYGPGQAQAQTVYFGYSGNGQIVPLRYDQSSQPASGVNGGGRYQDQQVGHGTAGQRQQSQNGYDSSSRNGHGLRNGHTTYPIAGAVAGRLPQQFPTSNDAARTSTSQPHQPGQQISHDTSQIGHIPSQPISGPAQLNGLGTRGTSHQHQPLNGQLGAGTPSTSTGQLIGEPGTHTPGYANGLGVGQSATGYVPVSQHGPRPASTTSNGQGLLYAPTNGYRTHTQQQTPEGAPSAARNGQPYRINGYGQIIPAGQTSQRHPYPTTTTITGAGGESGQGQDGFSPSYGVSRPSPEDPDGKKCTIITFSCTIVVESNGRAKICKPNAVKMNGNGNGQNGQNGSGSKICCC